MQAGGAMGWRGQGEGAKGGYDTGFAAAVAQRVVPAADGLARRTDLRASGTGKSTAASAASYCMQGHK
jgi:hypothetical protein